jgi:hypothetical protein
MSADQTNCGEDVMGFGFACAISIERIMEEFDNLPRPLRDFLNEASCEWSVSHVASIVQLERAGFLPSGAALRAMRQEDNNWRVAAYRQRGVPLA